MKKQLGRQGEKNLRRTSKDLGQSLNVQEVRLSFPEPLQGGC